MEENLNNVPANGSQPGKGAAVASLVLGILSVVCWFFNVFAFIGVICGIVGLILASVAKKNGFVGGVRTAGLVLSIIGLVGSGIIFVACIACAGAIGAAGAAGAFNELF